MRAHPVKGLGYSQKGARHRDQMGHDKGRVSVAGQLESWGHWQERMARGMQAPHHVGRNGTRATGSNERILGQGGKMLRFVFYKEHYSCRVQNGLERRADARKTSQKIVEVIRTPYTETLNMEGGEQGTDCGIIRRQDHQDLSPTR